MRYWGCPDCGAVERVRGRAPSVCTECGSPRVKVGSGPKNSRHYQKMRGTTGFFGKGWPKKPGTLLYFGGAVHEVLADGHTVRERKDLVPGTPKRLWKPKWAKGVNRWGTRPWRGSQFDLMKKRSKKKRKRNWIAKAFSKNKGALHRALKVPEGERIPVWKLRQAVKRGGRLAKRAQLVLNVRAARLRRRKRAGR